MLLVYPQKRYGKIKELFNKKHVNSRGYYCGEVSSVLKILGMNYKFSKVNSKTKKYLTKEGSIVFIKRSKKYPKGHYVLKTNRGWMNSWINFPGTSIKAGYNKKIPGIPQWIIYPITL